MTMRHIATAALVLPCQVSATMASAEGDPERGEVLYRPCAACHMIGTARSTGSGRTSTVWSGGVSASVEGYDFSDIFRRPPRRESLDRSGA
jgi:cytochrome c2